MISAYHLPEKCRKEGCDRAIRHDWTTGRLRKMQLPLTGCSIERRVCTAKCHDPLSVSCTLLSIKTGGCRRTARCPQSARYATGVDREELLEPAVVLAAARRARRQVDPLRMGAAWR